MRSLVIILLICSSALSAQTLQVRLEPFPPLVTEEGGGLMVALLKRVASISELRFQIDIVPYSRAKYQLRNGQADIIGPTPAGYESERFYSYAQELGWRLPTAADLFAMDPRYLDLPMPGNEYYVGAPLGNAEFFSELSGVPAERFVESTLPNLVEMLGRGRIQALMFERASTRAYIGQAGLEGVHYRLLTRIPAGLAVRRDEAGNALRARLEALFAQVDKQALLADYLPLMEESSEQGLLMNCPATAATSESPRVCPQE